MSQEGAMLTFGKAPAYQTDEKFDLAISPDGRALTLTLSDFEINSEASKSAAPIVTREFALVLPLEGEEKGAEIAFHVSDGFVATGKGATATIVFSVNGQTTVRDFGANADESFRQDLKLAGEMPSGCRIYVLLQFGRDLKNPNSHAFLRAAILDAEIRSRPA
jgi:hypothetical protein